MAAVNKLDKTKGLDLILHTPGGEMDATEQIVFYLRKVFQNDIRAIVPQIAMSAGTMIALSTKEIWMGLYSNLGPIDPQVSGAAAHAILEEFNEIKKAYAEKPRYECLRHPAHAGLVQVDSSDFGFTDRRRGR
jgi:ClpP class serine protease